MPDGHPPPREGRLGHRLLWFAGLWLAGLGTVSLVAYGLRALMF